MMLKFLDSKLGKDVKNKQDFVNSVEKEFKRYNYRVSEKTKEEQSVDEIVSKRMLQHLKQYFYESNGKSLKRRQKEKKNKSLKKK
jgi:hypothetical protein